ncbi:MAG TPA: hypothetical protein VGA88_02530 [Burkholderiales bacterium]
MNMTPPLRKFVLTAHVTSSVGWVGALAVFLAHTIAGVVSQDEQIVRAAWLAMGLCAWFVILPLSLTSLTTGVVQALGTAWGLLRHYWVVCKLLLTALATAVLLLKLAPISLLAEAETKATFSRATVVELQTSLLLHAAGGLIVLLTATVLAIYKPQGVTPYGRRKLNEEERLSESAASTPRWVKGFGLLGAALVVLVLIMLLHGGHGPGMHGQHG